MKQRGTAVKAFVIPYAKAATIQPLISEHVAAGTTVHTDEWWGYRNLPNRQAVRGGLGQRVDGQAHRINLEAFWSLMKRGL